MKYDIIKQIGKGGNSTVKLIRSKTDPNIKFACKIIPKTLNPIAFSEKKIKYHYDSIQKEVEIMKRLKEDSRIIQLEEVIEDDENVYIIMENCTGGDINDYASNKTKLSEECVRNIIKECLSIVAECHNKDIIHNDIKPENFLFKEENNLRSIKLIDFGISIDTTKPYDNLMFEMTPWFAAPETLSSQTCKKSDVWAIGVMTHLLLTGKVPFNDKQNPFKPSVYKIWNSILTDSVDFKRSCWYDISEEAKSFIASLLEKDIANRPTIYEAMTNQWITKEEFDINQEIGSQVVENLMKYNKRNVVMRTIFEDFVDILLERFDNDHTCYERLNHSQSENSLYNTDKAIISLNSSRLSYILHILREKTINRNDKVTKKDLKNVLKRLNSKVQLDSMLEDIKDENIDIKTIISSQIDWDKLMEDTKHFEQFLGDIFREVDNNDTCKSTSCKLFINDKHNVSFEEFYNKVNEFISDHDDNEVIHERVHGGKLFGS
jgi:calcium-dependent protein kinase